MFYAVKETSTAKLEQDGEVKDIPPSPTTRLLSISCPPPDDQRKVVRTLLSHTETELQAAEEEITNLQARLANAQHRERELTSCVQDLNALLSPINRMPPEIISRVFDFCGDVHLRGPLGKPSRRAPLQLGSVCGKWRTLSLAMPRLWTAFYLDLPTRGGLDKQEEILHAWIQRSRSLPISLWLWNNFLEGNVPAAFLRRLSHIIADNADRWRAIFVRFPAATQDWDCFDALVRYHMPALEELGISSHRTPWVPLRPEFLPCLRELQIPAGAISDSCMAFPGAQLTHLTLHGGYLPEDILDLFRILYSTPLLVQLHVEITQYRYKSSSSDALWPRPHVFMPCLATLVLVTIRNHEECIDHLLDALDTPALRDFQLLMRVWLVSWMTTSWCHDSFLGLLARSKCSLDYFTLVAVDISTVQLRQVMEHCPSLVLLKLNGMDVPCLMAPLLKDMTHTGDQDRNSPLVPWLKALSLSCESVEALDHRIDETELTFEQAFVQLVMSRTSGREPNGKVLKLQWIRWTIWWTWIRSEDPIQMHPHPELERRLARLCADKVDVGVSAATYDKHKRIIGDLDRGTWPVRS